MRTGSNSQLWMGNTLKHLLLVVILSLDQAAISCLQARLSFFGEPFCDFVIAAAALC